MKATAKIVTLINRTIIFHLLEWSEFLFQTIYKKKIVLNLGSKQSLGKFSYIQAGILRIQEEF